MAAERRLSIGFMDTFKSVFRLRKTSSRVSSAPDSSLSQDNGQATTEQDDSFSRSIHSHPTSPPPTSTSIISTDEATEATRSLPKIVDAAPARGHIPESQPTSTTSPTTISDSGKLVSRFKRFVKTPHAVNVEARALQPPSDVALIARHGFKQLSKNTEKFLEGTPFKIPIGVINTILVTADTVIQNRESVAIHFLPISERLNMVLDIMPHKNQHHDSIAPTCERFSDLLTKAVTVLEQMHSQGLFKRVLEANEHPQQITNICVIVDEATKNFQLELTLANVRQTDKIKTDTEISRLANLRPSKEVTYVEVEREPCVKGTREEVLESILTWCKDADSAPIYWLSGMAGTGKSTIAYTICETLYGGENNDGAHRLGASFFCSRQMEAGRARKNIVPTIAHDLALSLPSFGRKLLDLQFDAQLPPLKDHLRRLLLDPWCESIGSGDSIPPLVVVVDAVDELQDGEGSAFLEALIKEVRSRKRTLRCLKFLVTGRQDPHIVRVCDSIDSGTVLRLEDVPDAIVEKDITLYLRAKLPSLTGFVHRELAGQAARLFIYAATVVRFIVPPGDSEPNLKRVKLLLETWPDQTQRDAKGLLIDHLYADILSEQISPKSQVDKALALAILQTAVCSAGHTLLSDIPLLMNGQEVEEQDVKDVIMSLHAVTYVSDGRACFHHKSFLDFMLDSTRFGRHELAGETCSMLERDLHITSSCFHLMRSLRFNICDLPSSYLEDSQVPDLQKHKDNNISSALRYACRFWTAHLTLAHVDADDRETKEKIKILYGEWLEDRSLFWIEVMNLLGYMGECYFSLTLARKFLGEIFSSEEQNDHLALEKLVITFGSNAMAKSTPHLYLSALAASSPGPSTRIISRWLAKFPRIPRVTALHMEGPLTVLPHGDDWVLSVAFSPDGTRIVSCSACNTPRIWDVSTGIQLHQLVIDDYKPWTIHSACFSSGGRYVMFGSGSSVEVWDTLTWSPTFCLDGYQNMVLSISVSLKHVVSGSRDCTVHIWDLATRTLLHVLYGHNFTVQSVCFSMDGCQVASGSHDNTVCIWDVLTGKQLCQLDGHKNWVSSVCFSPDGTRVVSGSYDKTVHIWDILTGNQLYQLIGHEEIVLSVSFSPDGTHIASGSLDRSIRLWDASDGKELHRLDGHNDAVDSVCFSSDSTHIASGSSDGTVRIWDASRASCMTQLNGHTKTIHSFCSSPSGTYLVSGSEDKSVCVWDLSTGNQLHRFDGHNDAVLSVSCSPDGRYIASGSADNSVCIWDLATGIQMRQFTGHYDSFCSVSFMPDGSQIVSGSRNATVYIWNTLTGHQLHNFTLGIGNFHTPNGVPSMCFSPDGRWVICGSDKWSVWDVSTGDKLSNIRMEPMERSGYWVPSVCFSPDAANIASGLRDKTVRIWDLSTGEQLHRLNGHSGVVNSVCFSPDGSLIASGSADKTLCIWNASTGRQLHQLSVHNSSVLSVCFLSDGAQVISASKDNTIRVWDVASLSQFNGERCTVPFESVPVDTHLPSSRGMDTLPLRAALWRFHESGSMRADWGIGPDGWITSSTGERYMWLSDDMHSYLQRPDSFAISSRGSVEVDFTTGYFGTAWKECYELSAMERSEKDRLTECDEYTEDFEACGNSEGHDSDASESEC